LGISRSARASGGALQALDLKRGDRAATLISAHLDRQDNEG